MSWVTSVGYSMYTGLSKSNQEGRIHAYEEELMTLMSVSQQLNRMPNRQQAARIKQQLEARESEIKQKLELAKVKRQGYEEWQKSCQEMVKQDVKSFATFSEKA